MTLPGFLHIGYSKAASTWLQAFLSRQNDVFIVQKTSFFSPLKSERYLEGASAYSKWFAGAEGKRVVLESDEHMIMPFHHQELHCASTSLKAVETIARRIKTVLPQAKVILCIRNQLDMILSRYTQYIIQGGKADAGEFLHQLVFDNDGYLEYMDYRYSRVIDLLHEVFGKNNVLVLLQEQLKRAPQAVLQALSAFLQIDFSNPGFRKMKTSNAAPSSIGTQILRRVNRLLVREVETLDSRTRTKGPYLLWYLMTRSIRILDNWLIRSKKKGDLFAREDRRKIMQLFAEDNLKLGALLGIPIAELGYRTNDEL